PDKALASRGVLPKNVRVAVPVEVARTSDAPLCRFRWQIDTVLKRGAIHDPDNALASRSVLPKNVRVAIPVKIARTSDAPRHLRCTHHRGTEEREHFVNRIRKSKRAAASKEQSDRVRIRHYVFNH